MSASTYAKAVLRFRRSWKEAAFRLSLRSQKEKGQLAKLSKLRQTAAKELHNSFSPALSTCESCGRCCTKAAMDSGYYKHYEREAILNQGLNPEDWIVAAWPDQANEPAERCLFLAPTGCNIPVDYRSNNCLSYICLDKLAPTLVQLRLDDDYRKANKGFQKLNRKLAALQEPAYSEHILNFGDG